MANENDEEVQNELGNEVEKTTEPEVIYSESGSGESEDEREESRDVESDTEESTDDIRTEEGNDELDIIEEDDFLDKVRDNILLFGVFVALIIVLLIVLGYYLGAEKWIEEGYRQCQTYINSNCYCSPG